MKKRCLNYKYSLIYISLIILLNTLFSSVPLVSLWRADVSPMDWTVGIVYVMRDLAQRELGHKVVFAMLIASVLSYSLANKTIALASMVTFLIAEFIDWAVYTFTKRSLSDRILWSASLSVPVDSGVFLILIHQFNWIAVLILSFSKFIGVCAIWYVWRIRVRQMELTST